MTGNLFSENASHRFLLDESLAPVVARALNLVGYDIIDAASAMGKKGAADPEIIEWCMDTGAAWIHADDRARKQHRALLQTSGIRTLWLYRRRGAMSGREQLRILAFVLPQMIAKWESAPRVRHYRASAAGPLDRPSLRAIEL